MATIIDRNKYELKYFITKNLTLHFKKTRLFDLIHLFHGQNEELEMEAVAAKENGDINKHKEIQSLTEFINQKSRLNEEAYNNYVPKLLNNGYIIIDLFNEDDFTSNAEETSLYRPYQQIAFKYFYNVFEYPEPYYSRPINLEIRRVILPKYKFDEIESFIEKMDLIAYKDFVFYLISYTQRFYCEQVEFNERYRQGKSKNFVADEVKKVIYILDKYDYYSFKGQTLGDQRISFKIGKDKTYSIHDEGLIRDFINCFKNHYNNQYYSNWRKQLMHYPESFEEKPSPDIFKWRLGVAINNFVLGEGIYTLQDGYNTSDQALRISAGILEFSHLKVNEDPYDYLDDKIDVIRKKLTSVEVTPVEIETEIQPDFEVLNKYFEEDFLQLAPTVFPTYSFQLAIHTICVLFRLEEKYYSIMHIYNCLIEYLKRSTTPASQNVSIEDSEDTKDFRILMRNIQNQKIKEASFVYNDDTQLILKHPLPTYLINQAINEYYQNHPEEFELGITYEETADTQANNADSHPIRKLNNPEWCFLPAFCTGFYGYLKSNEHENPPELAKGDDFSYYKIIALVLQASGAVKEQYANDEPVINKIKSWVTFNPSLVESNTSSTQIYQFEDM
ncbi:MAG: hypothetical protein PHD25_04400 [Bacteroidales bacterium]|nr:hypothetical protein [Bacteroidales bacterium]